MSTGVYRSPRLTQIWTGGGAVVGAPRGTCTGHCGVVWCGVVWCGVVWCGVVWCAEGAVTKGQKAGMSTHGYR